MPNPRMRAAIIANDVQEITFLTRGGADPNASEPNGVSLLHGAAGWGNAEAIKALIDEGADPNTLTPEALFHAATPLHYAADRNNPEAARALIEGGANVHVRSGNEVTPLHCAALSGNLEVAAILLDAGADPKARTGNGQTPLHGTVPRSAATVETLLQAGADLNSRDENGQTPLHLASSNGKSVLLLLAAGADPNAQDKDGRAPLHTTFSTVELEEGMMMITALGEPPDIDADPGTCDADGNTSNPGFISRAPDPARQLDSCPRREDYVDESVFVSALDEFFLGERQTSYGMTEEASARLCFAHRLA